MGRDRPRRHRGVALSRGDVYGVGAPRRDVRLVDARLQDAAQMTTLILLLIWFTTPPPRAARPIDFARDVRPIVDRCQPCHFTGGKMYDKLPFDRSETIVRLGPKLFTRIKDE